jgi:hypothetical protein
MSQSESINEFQPLVSSDISKTEEKGINEHVIHMDESIQIDNQINIQNIEIPKCSALIDEHLQEIQNRINMHNEASFRYARYDKLIGYPITILASFLTSTILMSLDGRESSVSKMIEKISLSLSIISFVLCASRDYLDFSKKHNEHNISVKLYTNLLRSIEIRLINNHIAPEEKRDIFRDIVDQMSIIEQYELPIPCDITKKIQSFPKIPRSIQLGIP